MQLDWKTTVAAYKKELDAEPGFFSIKDLCDGLIVNEETSSYWEQKTTSDVLRWLHDVIDHIQSDIRFRESWNDMPTMQNILEYDHQEIEKIQELIARLEAE